MNLVHCKIINNKIAYMHLEFIYLIIPHPLWALAECLLHNN